MAIVTVMLPYRGNIHTLAYDNGEDFARHVLIDVILGSTGYRLNHYCERGLNEDTNGLISQYFPKQTDFAPTDGQAEEVKKQAQQKAEKLL